MRRFIFLFLATLLLGLVTLGQAQEEEDVTSTQVWINEYTEGADMLAYAAREVAKGNYKSSIEVYQGLIEKVRKEKDFATRVVESGEGIYLPLRKRCYEEILKLPPEGREIYGILYEAKADRMYEQAAAKQDVHGLVVVAQDYLVTPAGRKACLRLADLCIENAEYSLALHYLDTLTNYHCRNSEEPALCALKRAACLLQSGESPAAKRILVYLQKEDISEDEKSILKTLLELCKYAPSATREVFNSYYDGFVDLETPPSVELVEKPKKGGPDPLDWRFRLERKPPQQTNRGYMVASGMAEGTRGFDLFPVFYNDLLFVNDSTRIYALAAEGGKIKWREPDEESSKIRGLPLGCFVADGKLFAVLRNTNTFSAPRRRGRGQAVPAVSAVNELYCFDARRFGNNPPLWRTAPMRETTDLRQTSFTCIPCVDGSRVYVTGVEITEQDQNYNVCCFSTSGNFLWESRFCATKWTGQRSLLRAASLAVSRGKVIVCTNVGIAAALSAFTGELEWIYRYPQTTSADPATRVQVPPVTWQPTPPIVWYGTHPSDGKPCEALVLAPGDSDFILGFDMVARRLLWRWERTNHTFVIGPRGEDIFVYGGTSLESSDLVVRQHRIPDGLIRWEAKLPVEAFEGQDLVFGKGIATPKALYIPCSKQLLTIVDGKDERAYFGKVSASATWYSFKEEEEEPKSTEAPADLEQERLRRILAAQRRGYAGQSQQQPDETRLRGNLLLLPDRIITSGYLWTNCFRLRKGEDK